MAFDSFLFVEKVQDFIFFRIFAPEKQCVIICTKKNGVARFVALCANC